MGKIKLSKSDELEKLKFLTKLDAELCAKIYSLYKPYAHVVHKNSYKELEEKGYKYKIYIDGWDSRDYFFEHGKNEVDIIITILDSYNKVAIDYPESFKQRQVNMFREKHDDDMLMTKENKVNISIIPTILEADLIKLFETLQGKVNCILFNEIQSGNFSSDEIYDAFRKRYITLIKIGTALNTTLKDIEIK